MLDCPYCHEETPVPDECNEQDTPYEAECENCGKNFIFYVTWYPSYSETPAPCLNGGQHDYQKITGCPEEYFANKRRCSYCGDEITTGGETCGGEAVVADYRNFHTHKGSS